MQLNSKQFALDISLAPQASLRNFIAPQKSAEDQFALLDALKEVANSWKHQLAIPVVLSWIYCWGPEGAGKSHIIQAMENEAQAHKTSYLVLKPGDSAAWVVLKTFFQNQKSLPSALLIEDIDRLTEDEQNLLFRVQIEARTHPNIFLLCTGSNSVAGLKLREDIQSRLSWGLNFELKVLTDDQKILALHQAAQERGISLSNDVPAWLLNNFHRDLPSLLSVIEALDHFSLEKQRAITLPLLREFLQSPST
jgi:DnaA family protein